MTFFWRYENSEGAPQDGPQEHFTDQPGAEEWLSANWQDLVDPPVGQVLPVG